MLCFFFFCFVFSFWERKRMIASYPVHLLGFELKTSGTDHQALNQLCWRRSVRKKKSFNALKQGSKQTFQGGKGFSDFELTALTVHPDLELHSLQLLLPLVLVATAQQTRQIFYSSFHTVKGFLKIKGWKYEERVELNIKAKNKTSWGYKYPPPLYMHIVSMGAHKTSDRRTSQVLFFLKIDLQRTGSHSSSVWLWKRGNEEKTGFNGHKKKLRLMGLK